MRLPLEAFARVRARVGEKFVVGCRFLAEECIEGGGTVEDACFFAEAFASAGMDFLSTSRGGKFDDAKQPGVDSAAYPYTGPSGYECMPQYISDQRGPFGRNADATKSIRDAVRAAGLETPVVCTGGVHNFEMAEDMLARGVCDIVGAARQSLADPDWFLKTSLGLGAAVRTCEFTNYCEGLDQKHKQVTCQLWDKEALSEPGVALTTDGKRRLNAPDWSEADRGEFRERARRGKACQETSALSVIASAAKQSMPPRDSPSAGLQDRSCNHGLNARGAAQSAGGRRRRPGLLRFARNDGSG